MVPQTMRMVGLFEILPESLPKFAPNVLDQFPKNGTMRMVPYDHAQGRYFALFWFLRSLFVFLRRILHFPEVISSLKFYSKPYIIIGGALKSAVPFQIRGTELGCLQKPLFDRT